MTKLDERINCHGNINEPVAKLQRKQYISQEELAHIAWLARIELTEKERELFIGQINEILDYFRKIDEAHTEGMAPTYHVLDFVNIFRQDEVEKSLPKEEPLKIAPKKEGNFFKSPRMV